MNEHGFSVRTTDWTCAQRLAAAYGWKPQDGLHVMNLAECNAMADALERALPDIGVEPCETLWDDAFEIGPWDEHDGPNDFSRSLTLKPHARISVLDYFAGRHDWLKETIENLRSVF